MLARIVGQMEVSVLTRKTVQFAQTESTALNVVSAIVALQIGGVEEEVGHTITATRRSTDRTSRKSGRAQTALIGGSQIKAGSAFGADERCVALQTLWN